MKVNIITLGCSKNTVDSENLAGALRDKGHTVYFDRTQTDCDITIVNTCGFINDAKEESIEAILGQIAIKTRGRKSRQVYAMGCLVERYKEDLKREMPEVDGWFGTKDWGELVDEISGGETQGRTTTAAASMRSLSTPQHYAYIKISEGCNRSCSYCAIPLIRGAHRSRPMDEIVDEAKQLVNNGVKELILIAQDTTFYGLDLYHRRALGELLERLATESGAAWIRLHYTYPSSFPKDAIAAIARHENICNYIDIPLQHINTRILNSMQRGIDREGTLKLIEHFRQVLPDVAIRTTLIVGYPGEGEEEFEEMKEFVRQARFDRMGCFAYSPEEGTPAEHLGDPIPQEEKERRVAELMAIQEEISMQRNQERIGKTYRCIVDRREGDTLVGRTQYDSPEVDDEVLITQTRQGIRIGDFVQVEITDALEHDLIGTVV